MPKPRDADHGWAGHCKKCGAEAFIRVVGKDSTGYIGLSSCHDAIENQPTSFSIISYGKWRREHGSN